MFAFGAEVPGSGDAHDAREVVQLNHVRVVRFLDLRETDKTGGQPRTLPVIRKTGKKMASRVLHSS